MPSRCSTSVNRDDLIGVAARGHFDVRGAEGRPATSWTDRMSEPPRRKVINDEMTRAVGRDVVQVDILSVRSGERLLLEFESATGEWRQGVFLATVGTMSTNGVESSTFVLWQDSAPPVVDIDIVETDGLVCVYNVWDSGRFGGHHESLRATSGMLATQLDDGRVRYGCNDIGGSPTFEKLVFTVQVLG